MLISFIIKYQTLVPMYATVKAYRKGKIISKGNKLWDDESRIISNSIRIKNAVIKPKVVNKTQKAHSFL